MEHFLCNFVNAYSKITQSPFVCHFCDFQMSNIDFFISLFREYINTWYYKFATSLIGLPVYFAKRRSYPVSNIVTKRVSGIFM